MPTKLSKFTQENVICLLVFDEEHCTLARNSLTTELFDPPYQKVAELCFNYIDKFKEPPKDHIADELESYLSGTDGPKYQDVLASLYHLKENFNSKYVIEKLLEFIRDRTFEQGLYDAAELHSKGETVEAQEVIRKALDFNLTIFDPGIKVTDLHILSKTLAEENLLPTGVEILDKLQVGPAKGQVLVFIAPAGRGKSWWNIQLGKMALFNGMKVAHISLEISKEIAQQRYIQSILSISRWEYDVITFPVFKRDGNLEVTDWHEGSIEPRSMDDPDIMEHIAQGLTQIGPKLDNLRIKDFPTGSLTVPQLRAYLDALVRTENFIPDLVVLDHASHMEISTQDFRLNLGRLFVDLRGLAMENNFALATAHQMNKEGAKSGFTSGTSVSEDWSIMATVDTALVYNQSEMELKNKLARIRAAKGRSMRSEFTMLITQNYATGQFSLDSTLIPHNYDATQSIFVDKTAQKEGEFKKQRRGRIKVVNDE